MEYREIVKRRRALDPGQHADKFGTLQDAGWDCEWVAPIQQTSHDPTGPVVMGSHQLDIVTARQPYALQMREWYGGYMPDRRFNRVLDLALWKAGLHRRDVYVTQACHLLPRANARQFVPEELWQMSYDEVTKYELRGRPVIALGEPAKLLCEHYKIRHRPFDHPGGRGSSFDAQATAIAAALNRFKRIAPPSRGIR